jgi:hypothetical protein
MNSATPPRRPDEEDLQRCWRLIANAVFSLENVMQRKGNGDRGGIDLKMNL